MMLPPRRTRWQLVILWKQLHKMVRAVHSFWNNLVITTVVIRLLDNHTYFVSSPVADLGKL